LKSFISDLQNLNASNYTDIALRLFRYQARHNPIYAQYIHHLGVQVDTVVRINDIPFLPISFFKNHIVKTEDWKEEITFHSSGTTGNTTSKHFIADLNFYLQHAEECFTHFFGLLSQYHFLALMPSYLEQKNSSLIAMMSSFIQKSQSSDSRFYLNEYDTLFEDINRLKKDTKKKIILWGVSFALLDFADKYKVDLSNCLVFETGGMKGRRKEVTRAELHTRLMNHFNIDKVFSEYGMTELLSQAYTTGGEVFYPPPVMKVVVREVLDPLERGLVNRTGGINIIDLANIHSVAFIETEDAGKVYEDGSFEIIGRLDNSDVRGCNLMVE